MSEKITRLCCESQFLNLREKKCGFISHTIPSTIPTIPSPSPLPSEKKNIWEIIMDLFLEILAPFILIFDLLNNICFWKF